MENAMKRSLVVFALMAMSGTAFAEGFGYTYVQASYGTVDIDNVSVDGDGLGLNGSFGITDNLNIVAGYQTADFDSLADADEWSVGLGVHTPITEMMDVTAAVSYIDVEFDALGIPIAEDDGFGLNVGLRANLTSLIEVNAGVSYVDLSDSGDDTGFNGGVLFNFTDMFSLGLSGDWDDDVSVYSLSARVYFGK
jgi:long-subunit fatty acid transport protein